MQTETMNNEMKSWEYPLQCNLCGGCLREVAKLPQGVLLQCEKCAYLVNPTITTSTKPATPDKETNDVYMAVVRKSMDYIGLRPTQKVLDINSRDGTLLGWYNPTTFTFGTEPDAGLLAASIDSKRVDAGAVGNFSMQLVNDNNTLHGTSKFRLITMVDVLQDSLDPIHDIKDAVSLLHDDGLLVLQFPYLPKLMSTDKFVYCRNYMLVYVLRALLGTLCMEVQGVEVIGNFARMYVTRLGFKMFALGDYGEKLRLYMGVNQAMVTVEVGGRFDDPQTFKQLEEVLLPNKPRARNEL